MIITESAKNINNLQLGWLVQSSRLLCHSSVANLKHLDHRFTLHFYISARVFHCLNTTYWFRW